MTYLDYYPFGVQMPGRSFNSGEYRYGFQGQEKDDEIKGSGNSVNYKYRMHDPRIGRFFAVDPLAHKYPHNSPYAFSENMVIHMVELEGLEGTLPGHKTGSNTTLFKLSYSDGVLNLGFNSPINLPNVAEFEFQIRDVTGPNKSIMFKQSFKLGFPASEEGGNSPGSLSKYLELEHKDNDFHLKTGGKSNPNDDPGKFSNQNNGIVKTEQQQLESLEDVKKRISIINIPNKSDYPDPLGFEMKTDPNRQKMFEEILNEVREANEAKKAKASKELSESIQNLKPRKPENLLRLESNEIQPLPKSTK